MLVRLFFLHLFGGAKENEYICSMKQDECEELLTLHGVKPTSNRIVVLRALSASARPLTLLELENRILTIDKSGIFRTLSVFREHHLVHTIDDGSGAMRYELCHSQRTFCLDGVGVPQVAVPQGFLVNSANYILKGVCPNCR